MNEGNVFGYFPFTPIANDFINEYMLEANPIFVVIYIYILNKFLNKEEINLLEISNKMDILESDILKSLNYWKQKELIKFGIEDKILNIQFFNKLEKNTNKVVIKQEKAYTENEISIISKQQEVQELFKITENKFAKTLNYQERKRIIEIFYNYSLTMEIFVMLLTYCKEKNKLNFNYIEKIAIDWVENDIDTPQKVENYVKFYDENHKKIMKVFGLNNFSIAPVQMEYMKKWLLDFKTPMNMIEEACKEAIIKTGGPSFSYANSIIENWFKKGIKTMKDVLQENEKYKLEQELNNKEMKNKIEAQKKQINYQSTQKKNKFINFDEPEYDFDKLRELEIKYLKGEI